MDKTVLAYLAGAMDSDGFFSIRKSTYHRRVRHDATNATYSERIGLKQVGPDIPQLLRETFGGCLSQHAPQSENSKPLHGFNCTDKIAANACKSLLPFLRVKKAQAALLLELRQSKDGGYWQVRYWFEKEHPNWADGELITTTEVVKLFGYKSRGMVSQAVRNGTLLSLPYNYNGREEPRIPKALVLRILNEVMSPDGRARNQAPELVAWRESLYQRVKELNKIGVNGTPIYHRTGPYRPAEG